jgi:hypothetical protein
MLDVGTTGPRSSETPALTRKDDRPTAFGIIEQSYNQNR